MPETSPICSRASTWGASGGLGEKYALATAYAVRYERDSVPPQQDLERDLARFLGLLDSVSGVESGGDPAEHVWLFQANPAKYDIDRALRERDEITWVVRQYTNDVASGDRVYVWRSGKEAGVVAVGTIASDPSPLSHDSDDTYWIDSDGFDRSEPRVVVHIDGVLEPPLQRRDLLKHPVLKDLQVVKFANATNFRVIPGEDAALREAIEAPGEDVGAPFRGLAPVSSAVAEQLFLPVEWLQEAVDLLSEKRQAVFYGPPGTGKTFVALALCEHLTTEGGDFRLIQFHPSYSYEDFFEGYRPKSDGGGVEFALTAGPLREIAAAADADPVNPYILVIDEINRGNIPKIFGELLFLLEYRERVVQPQYSPQQPFALPPNLFLIGTMNTADRSIALVDAALRRRFYFRAFLSTEEPVSAVLTNWLAHHGFDDEPARLLEALNTDIADDEVAIGPSYFMTDNGAPPNVERVWQYAILPLLEEYYYGTGRVVSREFSLDRLRKRLAAEGESQTEAITTTAAEGSEN